MEVFLNSYNKTFFLWHCLMCDHCKYINVIRKSIPTHNNNYTLLLVCIKSCLGPLSPMIFFPSQFKFSENFSLFSSKFQLRYCHKILHMTWQLCCHGICKILWQSDDQKMNHKIKFSLNFNFNHLVRWASECNDTPIQQIHPLWPESNLAALYIVCTRYISDVCYNSDLRLL